MTRAALAGWLLVTYYGGTIAWYETEADCKVAAEYTHKKGRCVPDRFAVEELRTKP
jgi:hypothetical protein